MASGSKNAGHCCFECGASLKKDWVALNRKLISLDTSEFYCLECMAENFGCEVADLEDKISQFKEEGCTLF